MICEITVHIANESGVIEVPLHVTQPTPTIDAITRALQQAGISHKGGVIIFTEHAPYARVSLTRYEVGEWSFETPDRSQVICAGRVVVGLPDFAR